MQTVYHEGTIQYRQKMRQLRFTNSIIIFNLNLNDREIGFPYWLSDSLFYNTAHDASRTFLDTFMRIKLNQFHFIF